jgi:type IV pilus assembly protein PilY1
MNFFTNSTCSNANTGPTPVATCTPAMAAAGNSFVQTTCAAVTTGPTLTQTCNAAAADSGNNFTATSCAVVPAQTIQYQTTTTVASTPFSGGIATAAPTITTSTDALTNLDGVCYTPGVNNAPPLPSPGKPGTTWTNGAGTAISLLPAPTAPCAAWPCTTTTSLGGGVANSLADVAQYYYVTDLRPTMLDNVKPAGSGPEDDRVKHQHMTTFTIGLGVSGELKYRDDYRSLSTITGDFADIRAGTKAWPFPLADQPSSIDDFWHAAVNGRGQYFSAGNPTSVINGLGAALAGINATAGTGSAAASASSQGLALASNLAFQAGYTTQEWTGDLIALPRNETTGVLGAIPIWNARALLDTAVGGSCDNRNIFAFRSGASNNLVPFTWNTSKCDASGNPAGGVASDLNGTEQAFFDNSKVSLLSHYPAMTDGTAGTVNQRAVASGANLVNFIRGQRGREGFLANSITKLYRTRVSALADIVNSEPVYVKNEASVEYTDNGFAAYKTATESRLGMVYVGSNGGMLHAFRSGETPLDVDGGKEAWAFVPSAVMPNLYRLADNNYANNHIYAVDGSPTVFSAQNSSGTWRTLLVGGLRSGGKGYYALDVTDPLTPRALWEFNWGSNCISGSPAVGVRTDCHLGFTFGPPAFGKLADGTWVVFLSSGYNNVNSTPQVGDGVGYLYVVNAFTGQIISKTPTTAGNSTTPSGLAPVTAYADDPTKNALVLYVYGGDLQGNIWRFDAANGFAASLVGTAKDSAGTPQSITTVMPIRETNGKVQIIAGTGRLLGVSDIPNVQTQSLYSIVDNNATIADLRSTLTKIDLVASGSGATRTVTATCNASVAACEARPGWYADFPTAGERVVVDMKLFGRTLLVATSTLDNNPCNAGGTSQFYAFNSLNGLSPNTPRTAPPGTSARISDRGSPGLGVGLTIIRISKPDGTTAPVAVGAAADKSEIQFGGLGDPLKPDGNRVTWREVTQ